MQEIKIKLPENTTATLSIEDNWAVVEVMATEKPKFEIGWYRNIEFGNHILCRGLNDFCGFDRFGVWQDELFTPIIQRFVKADPKEVTRLLIDEAEKKYGTTPDESRDIGDLFFMEGVDLMTNGYSNNSVVFDGKTGKWAEIIPEKRPYINQYFTPFNEGEDFYWVHSNTRIVGPDIFDRNSKIDNYVLFMGTERECHRYLDENWDELNKNK